MQGGKGKAAASKSALTSHNAGGKSIEETYQKLSQLEHILLRPDTYIGSTEKQQQSLWVHDGERMVLKNVTFAPGLYKIFDEILVNAADNKIRDPTMDTLRIDIDEVGRCSLHLVSCLPQVVVKACNRVSSMPFDSPSCRKRAR